jgi:hypothetical protein
LATTAAGGALSAIVPRELYAEPGERHIYVVDSSTGQRSNPVVLKVSQ